MVTVPLPVAGNARSASQDVPLPVRFERVPVLAVSSESCKPVTDSLKSTCTPVEPPDSPDASSKVIVAVARAVIVKSCETAVLPGLTASSAIATVIVPAAPAVTDSVQLIPEPVSAPRVPPVTVISDATKSVMSISLAILMSTASPARMSVSVGGQRKGGLTCDSAIKGHS